MGIYQKTARAVVALFLLSPLPAIAGDYSFTATFNGSLVGLFGGTYYDGSGYGVAPNSCPPSVCVFSSLPMSATFNGLLTTEVMPGASSLTITETISAFSQLGSNQVTSSFTTPNLSFIPNVGSWAVSVGPLSSGKVAGGADVNATTTPFIPLAGTSGTLALATGAASLQKNVGASLPGFPGISIPNTLFTGNLTSGLANYSTGTIQPPTVQTLALMTFAQFSPASSIPNQKNPDGTTEVWSAVPADSVPPQSNGFAATVYQTADQSQTVIAMRGGSLSGDAAEQYTIASALSTFTNNPGDLITSQTDELADLVKTIRAASPNTQITLTSYSVGGLPVQIVAKSAGIQAVTFDSQGAANLLSAFTGDQHLTGLTGTQSPSSQIYNYRLQGDQVSLWSPQVGLQVTVQNPQNSTDPGNTIFGQHDLSTLALQIGTEGLNNPTFPGFLGQLDSAGTGNEFSLLSSVIFGSQLGTAPITIAYQNAATAAVEFRYDPPPAWSYSLTETANSPRFTSISLPLQDNIAGWELTYFTDFGTSGTEISDTGIFNLVAGVDRLDFFAFDDLNNQIMVVDPFNFDLTFDSDGTFNGTLVVTQSPSDTGAPVPEPSSLMLLLGPLVGLGVLRQRRLATTKLCSHRSQAI